MSTKMKLRNYKSRDYATRDHSNGNFISDFLNTIMLQFYTYLAWTVTNRLDWPKRALWVVVIKSKYSTYLKKKGRHN